LIMTVQAKLRGDEKDLGGGFLVSRLLPSAQRQSIGPFVFFDHFGPLTVQPGASHDVRPHPHIGLATVTYLLNGAMMHRDSLGSVQRIEPGAVNWMSAGRGIVHSERAPDDLKHQSYVQHGLQLWAALPQAHEESAPVFSHTPAADIPVLSQGGVDIKVLVGEAFGLASPVNTFSKTVYLDVSLAPGARIELPPLADELAVYVVEGELQVDGEALPARTLALLTQSMLTQISASANAPARLVVIGGDKLDGPRFIWWNFVSSRKERMMQAADDWVAQKMGQVAGDNEFIPLPERRMPATAARAPYL
jgi:redox-sensitive bicupin YhaK (pirin superfamily)